LPYNQLDEDVEGYLYPKDRRNSFIFPCGSDIILYVGDCETAVIFRRNHLLTKAKCDTCLSSSKMSFGKKRLGVLTKERVGRYFAFVAMKVGENFVQDKRYNPEGSQESMHWAQLLVSIRLMSQSLLDLEDE